METSFEEDIGTKMKEEPLESETESQSMPTCVSPSPPLGVLIKQENQEDNYSEVDISRTNSLTSSVKLLDK